MNSKLFLTAVLLVAASFTAPGPAALAADDPAEDLIAKGVDLRMKGQNERALELFRRAHATSPSGRTLAQMGLAEQSLKRWLESEGHLASALADDSHPWVRKNQAHLQNALEAVRSHIGALKITGTPGATVYAKGERRGTLPLGTAVRLGEGEVTVEVTEPNHQPFSRTVMIPSGGVAEVDAQLRSLASPPPAPSPPQPSAGRPPGPLSTPAAPVPARPGAWGPRSILGISLVGVGAAAAVGGGVLLLRNGDECATAPPAGFDCQMVVRSSRAPGWALLGTGAAAALAGGVILVTRLNVQVEVGFGPSLLIKGRL